MFRNEKGVEERLTATWDVRSEDLARKDEIGEA